MKKLKKNMENGNIYALSVFCCNSKMDYFRDLQFLPDFISAFSRLYIIFYPYPKLYTLKVNEFYSGINAL